MGKNKKKLNVKNLVCILLIFVFLGLIVFSSIKIAVYVKSAAANREIMDEIDDFVNIPDVIPESDPENPEEQYNIEIDFDKLKEMNKDVVGWIKINNTRINYPVVKGKDNEFYLKHNLKKNWNEAGWIFADYENKFDGTDKNIVIYGHSMKNKTMFGDLSDVLKHDWYSNPDNLNITLVYNNMKYTFKIFSAYKIEAEDYYINTHINDFADFVNKIKNRSQVNYNTSIKDAEQILTLSTCYDNNNLRLAVHAVKVSEEKMDEE
jgi:sortase B